MEYWKEYKIYIRIKKKGNIIWNIEYWKEYKIYIRIKKKGI